DTRHYAERARCPGCQALLDVPADLQLLAPLPETVGLEETLICPGCKKQWPAGTALCVECGYDFRTAKKVKRKYQVMDESIDLGLFGTYTRFTLRRDQKGKLSLIRTTRFLWIPLGTWVISLKDYDAVATNYSLESNGEFEYDQFYLELWGRGRPLEIWRGTRE